MLLNRTGFPEEGELVISTVTKIFHHSVFVNLDEYNNRSGLIHISEISPGRIRNLRDYVAEGKKIVTVVLRIDTEKGHIDLSLRRVNERQRIGKNSQIKMEQKSEKIIELISKKNGEDLRQLYETVFEKVNKKYETLTECFEDVVLDLVTLESLGIDKHHAKDLTEVIRQRMKPPIVQIKGQLSVVSYKENGIDLIKEALQQVLKSQKDLVMKYGGAGKYNMSVTSDNFKDAEKKMQNAVDKFMKSFNKSDGIVEYKRVEA